MADLMTSVPSFVLRLPWSTEIGAAHVTEATFDFLRSDWRSYGDMEIGQYANTGPEATPVLPFSFCLVVNGLSFNHEAPGFKDRVTEIVVRSLARWKVNTYVILSAPPAYPVGPPRPLGIGWPLSEQVITRLLSASGALPVLRGLAVAFRVCSESEFAAQDEILNIYRGSNIPPV